MSGGKFASTRSTNQIWVVNVIRRRNQWWRNLPAPQTSFGVRSSRIHFSPTNECVTNEPQRTSAGRLVVASPNVGCYLRLLLFMWKSCYSYCKMTISNSFEQVCNRTRSSSASLLFKAQATKHTTVAWPVCKNG